MNASPALLQLVLQACTFFILATPIAIIAWLVVRWRRTRRMVLRPAVFQLIWWVVIAIGGLFLLMFASGGHKASPEVELGGVVWILVLTGMCARWLWTLYGTIGLPRR